MAKYIEREAFIEWLKRIPLKDLSDGLGLCRVIMEDDFKKAIKEMPEGIVVDVEPVRRGRWVIPTKIGYRSFDIPHCSVCNGIPCGVDGNTNYCPNCGAKMDGGDNSATD